MQCPNCGWNLSAHLLTSAMNRKSILAPVEMLLLITLATIILGQFFSSLWSGMWTAASVRSVVTGLHLPIPINLAPIVWLYIPNWIAVAIACAIVGYLYPRRWGTYGLGVAVASLIGTEAISLYMTPVWIAPDPRQVMLFWLMNVPAVPLAVCTSFSGRVYGLRRLETTLRKMGNSCAKCNYDLRGTGSGICPECGAPVEQERRSCVDSDDNGFWFSA